MFKIGPVAILFRLESEGEIKEYVEMGDIERFRI